MKDAAPAAVYLSDYTPPAWLVERVELTFRLHPTATRVLSRIVFRPNDNFDTIAKVELFVTIGDGSDFSFIVIAMSLTGTLLVSSMAAYVIARFQFPGNRAIYYLMLAGLTFPIFLAIVPLFFVLRNIGLLNTLPGLILTYAAFALPFTVFFLFSFFKALPLSIAEAAIIAGLVKAPSRITARAPGSGC